MFVQVVTNTGPDGCRGRAANGVGRLVEDLQPNLESRGELARYNDTRQAVVLRIPS